MRHDRRLSEWRAGVRCVLDAASDAARARSFRLVDTTASATSPDDTGTGLSQLVQFENGASFELREGDIVLTRWNRVFPSFFIALLNDGISHSAIVLQHDGQLWNIESSRYAPPLPDSEFLRNSRGEIIKRGVHGQLLRHTFGRTIKHLWVLRPAVPFTDFELAAMRAEALRMIDAGTPTTHNYERRVWSREYLHALCGLRPYTTSRYMCSENTAVILRAGGRWGDRSTAVMPSHIRRRVPGPLVKVF